MIGIVVAAHSLFPSDLIEDLAASGESVHIYLFFHGHDVSLRNRLTDFARSRSDVTLLNYGINRGLSRSWSEGIWMSRHNRDEFVMLVNDDLRFIEGGFRHFINFVRTVPPGYGIVTVNGLETSASPIAGHILPQDFACCVVGNRAIEEIGYFDTNFRPAYFEDMDYKYRMALANLVTVVCPEPLVEHDRSATSRVNAEVARSFNEDFTRNREYYARKWGGEPGAEKYRTPFGSPGRSPYIDFEELLTLSGDF